MKIEVDTNARCYARETILINSSADKVFSILSDINGWPSWQSSVTKAEVLGPVAAGTKFRWKAGGLDIHSELHTVTPNSEIGWTGKIWWIKAIHNWYLSNENNYTKVVVMESLKGPGSSFMKKSLAEGMKKNLAELKNRAENM